jgi:hypothetical protein
MRARRRRYASAIARAVGVASTAAHCAIGPTGGRTGIAIGGTGIVIGGAGIMVRAAACAAVHPSTGAGTAAVRRSTAVIAAATTATSVESATSTPTAVEAAAPTAAMTATTMLCKCSRRAEQRQCREHRKDNL